MWGGHYEPGTLIWRSCWVTDDGIVECREALAFPGEQRRAVMLRRIIARDVTTRLSVVLAPAAGFDAHPLREAVCGPGGLWYGRVGDLCMRWSGAETAQPTGPGGCRLAMELTVEAGTHHDLVLELGDRPLPDAPPDPDACWRATEGAWRRAVPDLAHVAPTDARHAVAVLRGLTGGSGGMVAAATTSLPEQAAEGRDYDYRYVRIRDQCYAGQAVAAAGVPALLDDAVRFVSTRLLQDGPRLMPAYRMDGRPVPSPRRARPAGLPRWLRPGREPGQRTVPTRRLRRDVAATGRGRPARPAGRGRPASAVVAAEAIGLRRHDPDAGIWELAPRRWAHSRLICAAGLRAYVRSGAAAQRSEAWTALAAGLVEETCADSLHPSGRWQRAPGDTGLDGALLLPAIRGALPAGDPRSVATLDAYVAELADEHFAYRFRHGDRPLGEAEGAFLLCGFVTALAEHQQGREVAAFRWFERNRGVCGPTGLFAEEYDVAQRQLRGNLPQAFVHALILECAVRLAGPWTDS